VDSFIPKTLGVIIELEAEFKESRDLNLRRDYIMELVSLKFVFMLQDVSRRATETGFWWI